MLRGGESVLVAVSGGPDSVALIDVLREAAAALRLRLAVAHVHHGLRGEADRDAEHVRALADRLAVPFHLERVTVRGGPPWEGLEAEARRVRLAALTARARAIGADRIATGHTADDQAETVLMRVLDGAGPRGLAGIRPARGPFIRPLIDSRRADVLAHLAARGLAWVEDESNRDPRFLRNRIRHDVLPALIERIGPSVPAALCRSAALHRALVDDLEQRARTELSRIGTRGPSGVVFAVADVRALTPELAAETVLQAAAMQEAARPRRGAVYRAIRRLVTAETPRRMVVLGGLAVERSGRWMRVGPVTLPPLAPRRLIAPGSIALDEVALRLDARCFDRPDDYTPPRERHRVAFDADRLPRAFIVRPRRQAERFSPFGGVAEQRIKSLLSDAGVPRWERPRVPLLEADGHTVWVVGVRRGRTAPIEPTTKRILEVTVVPL
jgi:tRNA(Ile)-lysidine synthase